METTRRRVLAAVGTAGASGVAGCASSFGVGLDMSKGTELCARPVNESAYDPWPENVVEADDLPPDEHGVAMEVVTDSERKVCREFSGDDEADARGLADRLTNHANEAMHVFFRFESGLWAFSVSVEDTTGATVPPVEE
jgi:hypothetical protein